jgi:RNA polymerase sigma-70 factor (ECF subfamily)
MEVHDAEMDLQPEFLGGDPVERLTEVYRDYPGLRAHIIRRVRDPQIAADILQDAAVTTLEKLRAGKIAEPGRIGGYLLQVALNHLRNYRRKDRSAVSSSEEVDSIPDHDAATAMAEIDRAAWARAARALLKELPTARDRDLLVRYYLDDESKEEICAALGLSDEHFNRVIFRAKNRFRELLERRGYVKSDLLSWLPVTLSAGVVSSMLVASGRVA